MFLKIEGHLLDVLGEKARDDIKGEFGIDISPIYQFIDKEPPVTLAKIVNPVKAEQLFHDSRVTILNTIEEFNNEIDILYEEMYTLVDSTALMLDIQFSGKSPADIPGYDTNKSMQAQANLKALYEAGLAGISKNKKPPYLTE